MTKLDVERIFSEISKKKNVSVGIDKVGVRAAKKTGLDKIYVEKVFKAIKGEKYHFTKYKQLLQIKGENKNPRVISIPCLRDRLLFKTIYEFFLKEHVKRSKFEKIIKQVHIDAKNGFFDKVSKFDIKSFFDSIPHDLLEKSLFKEGIDRTVISLLMKAVKVRTVKESDNTRDSLIFDDSRTTGIPQGIIVGNALAEIFAQQFDGSFNALVNAGKIRYHRFVDDILIFYNSKMISDTEVEEKTRNILASYCLEFQTDKVVFGKDTICGFDFLGFSFNGPKISVLPPILKKKEKKIERVIFDFCRSTHPKIKGNYKYLIWKLNLEVTGFVANTVFYGWTSSYRFINDYGVYRKLDYTVKMIYLRAGLDMSYYNEIKTFAIAHNMIKRVKNNKTDYIPNFDTIFPSLGEKKTFLVDTYGIPSSMSNEHIEDLFDEIVKKEIYDVERDLDLKYGI